MGYVVPIEEAELFSKEKAIKQSASNVHLNVTKLGMQVGPIKIKVLSENLLRETKRSGRTFLE